MTDVPGQKGFNEAEMDILTGRPELTIIIIGADVQGLLTAQVTFALTVQVTTSPFRGIYP